MDNEGATEFVLFTFNNEVALTDVAIGWPNIAADCSGANGGLGCDTDMTLLAYTGAGTLDTAAMAGLKGDNLVNGANFKRLDVTNVPIDNHNTTKAIGNSTAVGSKYWLVGAYSKITGVSAPDALFDYMKIAVLKGCASATGGNTGVTPLGAGTCGGGSTVPEPSSLDLVGLGMLGGIGRWKAGKAA